ncbi:MAG: hypothetical protein RPT25_00515, partial [Cycloclasticus sp.]
SGFMKRSRTVLSSKILFRAFNSERDIVISKKKQYLKIQKFAFGYRCQYFLFFNDCSCVFCVNIENLFIPPYTMI